MNSKTRYNPLVFADFLNILHHFGLKERSDFEVIYDLYVETVKTLNMHHELFVQLPFVPLDHVRLILFLINDYTYRFKGFSKEDIKSALREEVTSAKFINAVIDKYGGESYFKYDEGSFLNPFSTEISTINVYINFILLKIQQLNINEGHEKLYSELLRSAFSMCRTISELLVHGFEREALSAWRSLHELEATLILLEDGTLMADYQKHIIYNASFNGLLPKEETDANFLQLKAELKEKGLKSKDMRRYIEYGWITNHPNFNLSTHKYNFRDGVEALAGLEEYRETYQVASEVSHSSPVMLFTRRSYFLKLALINLYKSFILIENLFANLYISKIDELLKDLYNSIRKLYLEDIKLVYERASAL